MKRATDLLNDSNLARLFLFAVAAVGMAVADAVDAADLVGVVAAGREVDRAERIGSI